MQTTVLWKQSYLC